VLANLEVKWLYDVIALEESRSFTLAAKSRNISQSSFSRRIQALEASLGFSIFDRSANPLQLTNRGKIFVGYARNMLDDMDFQISRIKGLNNTTQKIRIDAAPHFPFYYCLKSSPVIPTERIKLFMLNRLTSTMRCST
jgi:DNA-binding transcriptional LysR family regulator